MPMSARVLQSQPREYSTLPSKRLCIDSSSVGTLNADSSTSFLKKNSCIAGKV